MLLFTENFSELGKIFRRSQHAGCYINTGGVTWHKGCYEVPATSLAKQREENAHPSCISMSYCKQHKGKDIDYHSLVFIKYNTNH